MFNSILTGASSGLSLLQVILCLVSSLVCGIAIALTYRACAHPSKNFSIALAILPAIVQIVILMVNGNLGVGVAVAGSFSLVRFRSLPGKSSDIVVIFLAMGVGLATGMGYVYFAMLVTALLCLAYVAFSKAKFLDADPCYRYLRITIPEDLDYVSVFKDILENYTSSCELDGVRTVNLGSMYQVSYELRLKNAADEKKMIDQLRCRNGNLSIICSRQAILSTEL